MNSIEAATSPPLSLLPNNQPFFRRYWVGDIHGINQAIGYIQSLTTVEDTLNQFWAYFNRTWMVRFPPNICSFV
ncbi:hypothetical protein HZS_2261 [Henneguya salminicola]|nr:hypothetical protein HZS_2261 [Henneguya salminicola]